MDSQNNRMDPERFSFWPLAVFAAVMLVALLAGKLLFDELREGFRQEAQGNISAVGTLRAHQIEDLLEDRVSDVKALSDDSFFSHEAAQWMRGGARDDGSRRQLVEHLSAFLESHHFRAIVLYDIQDRVVLNVGTRIPDAQQMGVEASHVLESGLLKFIDLHRHQGASLPVAMGFMSPMHDGASNFGVVYLAEDPAQYLFPLLREWPSDKVTAETHLVRMEGERVVYLNQLRNRPEQPLGFSLPLDTPHLAAAIALRGKLGLLENARDYRGKQVLSYAIAIQGTPWVLISKIDEQEVGRIVDWSQRVAALLAVIVTGVFGIIFWYWHRRVRLVAEAVILKERVRTDALVKEAEKRCLTIFEHTLLPMMRSSLQGEIVEANDAWCNMFGYEREEIASQHLTWLQLTHADDLEHELALVKKLIAGEIEEFKIEKRYLRKDGKLLWGGVHVSLVRDAASEPESIACIIQDITARKQAELQISFMAYHDKLTGLPNRALLFDRLSQGMSQAKRDAKHLALLFVDLDGFKAVNDKHGHEAGDAVLRMAAQRFLACVRAVDTVARFGGDEFAIVLGSLDDSQQAKGVAEKIIQAFAQGLSLPDGQECYVGASVGISIYPEHGSAMDNLITAADQAMYESKHHGKNTYTFFKDEELPKEDTQWLKFEDSHLVGVHEIDEQHRNLAYLVNRLNDGLKHNESAESIQLMLDELLVATVHHFETESRFMTEYHYPEQLQHEDEHARLVNEAQHFKEQFSQGRELLILQSIKDWLLGHMAYSDKRLAAYLPAARREITRESNSLH